MRYGVGIRVTSQGGVFLEELAGRRYVSWLGRERGRLRIELAAGGGVVERWTLAFDGGRVAVSEGELPADADAVLRLERDLFDRAVRGEDNLFAAGLRGETDYEGDRELLVQLARLLPGPSGQRGPRRVGPRRAG